MLRATSIRHFVITVFTTVLLVGALGADATSRHPVRGHHGAVATSSRIATEVGVDILKQGGNAVDAAIATAFAMAVTWPTAGNIGGGGFLVYHGVDGEAITVSVLTDAYLAVEEGIGGCGTHRSKCSDFEADILDQFFAKGVIQPVDDFCLVELQPVQPDGTAHVDNEQSALECRRLRIGGDFSAHGRVPFFPDPVQGHVGSPADGIQRLVEDAADLLETGTLFAFVAHDTDLLCSKRC